jgi:1-acyl-sn-glycerol-3-phosphate acyltransferase
VIGSIIAGMTNLISGASVRWVGCEPSARQRIYFANHTSNLDGAVVWGSLPPETRKVVRLVAAHDYWTKNKLRYYIARKGFNAILIERKKVTASNNPLDFMLEALGTEYSLIIFPEGRRNTAPGLAPFKSGLYHLGKRRPDIELVPVYIDNMNRILPRGEILPVPLLACIMFGTPLHVGEGESKNAFLERAQASILSLKQI